MLLGYFGEDLREDCGNCDVCLEPPEQYDATEDARKALSCVYRVGQRFGMAPSQYLHVKDRTLAYALDERCHVAASRVEREAREAAAGKTHYNEGGINE